MTFIHLTLTVPAAPVNWPASGGCAVRHRHLLSPGEIGGLAIKNRIVMSAMGTDLAADDGIAGERIRAYYETRARGGVGLVVTEAIPVAFPAGFSRPHAMALQTETQIAAVRELVRSVQRHGARIALQLNHHGPMSKRDMVEGRPLLVPSEPQPAAGDIARFLLPEEQSFQQFQRAAMPPVRHHVMSTADIADLVAAYSRAAARARDAGADAIEIHAAHGFLLSAFLSPRTNRRSDSYGGNRENRARLLVEVIRAVRAATGEDFPVWCKIDTAEYLTDAGIGLDDAIETARLAVQAGAAAIMASTSADPSRGIALTESNIPDRCEKMIPNAVALRRAIAVPVIAAGRMEPASANRHIRRGDFDFAGFGRKLLADPDFAAKLAGGREEDIRPCIYCYACISQLSFDRPVKCAVNAETGHEMKLAVRGTPRPRAIAVVGGGPAGMEASRRLALAGHKVTLLEESTHLGGTLRFAALAYRPNERLLDWLRRQTKAAGVTVRTGMRADPRMLTDLSPDVVVVAGGAVRAAPSIPGRDRRHVFSGEDLRAMLAGGKAAPCLGRLPAFALRLSNALGLNRRTGLMRVASRLWMPIGRNVVVIGAELVGLELAEFLLHRGRNVTLIDEAPRPGAGLHIIRRARVIHDLERLGAALVSGASDIAIRDDVVSYRDAAGKPAVAKSDTVIIAKGARADRTLAETLRESGFDVREIGDGKAIGYIEGAMADAAELARVLSND